MPIKDDALEILLQKIELSSDETVKNVIRPESDDLYVEAEEVKKLINSQTAETEEPIEFENSTYSLQNAGNTNSSGFIDKLSSYWKNIYATNEEEAIATKDSRVTYGMIGSIDDSKISSFLATSEITVTTIINSISDTVSDAFSNITESGGDYIKKVPMVGSAMAGLMTNISGSVSSMAAGLATALSSKYNDGVQETPFGAQELTSWQKFILDVKNGTSAKKINVLKTTPLDSGDNSSNLYGTMMLGCPPTFNSYADPLNRAMLNSFIKDSKFLSLTPGLPKYNGSRYNHAKASNAINQTTTTNEMLDYLIQNGVNSSNLSKDKRYYVFNPAYGKFYSYLETMLNTIWIKLGLGTEDNNTFNLFTFFNSLELKDNADPKSQYQSAIGFFVNPVGTITENINNERSSTGSSLGQAANDNADVYQRLSYITGMGTGSHAQQVAFTANKGIAVFGNLKNYISGLVSNTVSGWQSGNGTITRILGAAMGVTQDYFRYSTEDDQGAILQAYTAVNGMKVMYPELWRDSSYSKSMNFDFNFTSPYGDPLSIFKYVFVPFCTLLCFTLPRQADDNGYVSPFFLRADLPGYFSCDLGMVSSFSFVRGGAQGLFTKDGLPRSISGSFTIDDLFPYLAMTRRISFLSANPSYTSFLDSMIGFNALYKDDSDSSSMNEYFKQMLNRINGNSTYSGNLWNQFDSYGRAVNKKYAESLAKGKINIKPKNINWLKKV